MPAPHPKRIPVLDRAHGVASAPIRAEIFGWERFAQHGISLGQTHHAAKAVFGQATFYPRLRHNIRFLQGAHRYIAEQIHEGHGLSPAADWLVDNFHVIEDQLREIHAGLPRRFYRSLPVLQQEPLAGLPRIYGVAWAFVAHTDSAFDEALLVHFLQAYQTQRELTQAELWALPTTLRVVLVENLRRLADRLASHKAASLLAQHHADQGERIDLDAIQRTVNVLALRGVERVFTVQLAQALAGRRVPGDDSAMARTRLWLQGLLPDLASAVAQQHADQVADNLSMGNAVTSLRLIGSSDWPDIVTHTSLVMQTLLASPVFLAEDFATRDHTLHAIERLSARCARGESDVAACVMKHMQAHTGPEALAQHWLHGPGRATLDAELGLDRRAAGALHTLRNLARLPTYLLALLLGSAALVWATQSGTPLLRASPGDGGRALDLLAWALLWFPASETVVAVVNRLVSESVKPSHLPRYELAQGIPPEERVLVVMPALLSDASTIAQLVHRLHLHHLANPEAHAQFALLSDWPDADRPSLPTDADLLTTAQKAIAALNRQHPPSGVGGFSRFLLLHRARSPCETQRNWMGWERKRGKLEQLMATLATGAPSPFLALGALSALAPGTRHLLTLDSDTQLPPGQLRALVGVAAHPQNHPRLDTRGRRVVAGYTLLQPRVLPPLPSPTENTLYHWLFAGVGGIDPYSAMSSDVYQDLFAEGSFHGKGLIHVAAAHAVLGRGRLPAEQILSHDLLEGALARCAVVSDVTLIESDPSQPDMASDRLHRWTRGDWQLLPFLVRPHCWPMAGINRWKLIDNLRRSLLAPASALLLLLSMVGVGATPSATLALVLAAHGAGPVLAAAASWVPAQGNFSWQRWYRLAALDIARAVAGGMWHLSQLLRQAMRDTDAVVRTLYRLSISRQQLLAWRTAASQNTPPGGPQTAHGVQHRVPACVALGMLGVLWWMQAPLAWPVVSVLLAWVAAPALSWAAGQRLPRHHTPLSPDDQQALHGVARDTWRLFERTVDANSHHLPPDNLQTSPVDMVATRTSPTNVGLYLLSAVCARQFGWLGTQDLLDRLEATLATLDTLARHRGHFLNWTDTQTLQPLHPRYVSTVDSGNLSAHLLATAQACREWAKAPFDPGPSTQAVQRCHARLQPPAAPRSGDALARLQADLQSTLSSAQRDALASQSPDGPMRASQRLNDVAHQLETLAWAPDYTFLYHPKRHLFHIGYRVEEQALDSAFYDLLASESRMTSLLAIAKGDVPVIHWAALGRPYFAVGMQAGLRSWSGSMFEYLMPGLILSEPRGSALREAGQAAVTEQVAFVRHLHMPWGMSECGYAERDTSLAYQYAPQGVPRLALRRTPAAERVVAPYATALAAQVNATLACANLHAFEALGARGAYGFCEALDFTPSRQTSGRQVTRVQTHMAHHQGMTIVALANVLLEQVAQRWGMGHPALEAVQSLLHERAPRQVPVLRAPPPGLPAAASLRRTSDHTQCLAPGESAAPPTLLLSNGRYSLGLRPNGAGHSRWESIDIHRCRDDVLRDTWGQFVYVRTDATQGPHSLTLHPAPDPQATYQCEFHADRVQFSAQWPHMRAQVSVWISPEDDIELRRVLLCNTGEKALELDLMAAFDVTLTSRRADDAHPAFSNLFVQAHWHASTQALVFQRTPRLATESPMHCAHFVAHTEGEVLGVQHQTDRQLWLGRNHAPSGPQGILHAASQASGPLPTGLDPVSVLSVRVRVPPGGQAVVTFGTAASDHHATLLAVLDKYRQPSSVERSSVMSATLADIRSGPHPMRPDFWPVLQTLVTALLFTLPKQASTAIPDPTCDRRLLWPLALSGDQPLLLVEVSVLQGLGLLRTLLQALRGWARAGLPCDVVILSSEAHSYHMPLHLELMALRDSYAADQRAMPLGSSTRLHLHRTQDLTEGQLTTLDCLARIRLHADGRPLRHHVLAWLAWQRDSRLPALHRPGHWPVGPPVRVAAGRPTRPPATCTGRFTDGGRSFAFEAGAHCRPTRPWVNVLANPDFGTLVSEAGGGHTWARNSRLHQLTPWANDPVADPPGEWFLLQDRRSQAVWSLSPSAWGDPHAAYQVTHGMGTTRVTHRRGDLGVSVVWCVDPLTAVKHIRIELTNHGATRQHLRLLGMVEWQMGERRGDRATTFTSPVHHTAAATPASTSLRSASHPATVLLCSQAEESAGFGRNTAFLTMDTPDGVPPTEADRPDWTCDRREFLDSQGQWVLPHRLGQHSGWGLDPCAALARHLTLHPGQQVTQVFLLGHAPTPAAAAALAAQALLTLPTVREQATSDAWADLQGTCQVQTPDPLFDALLNHWLLYQTVSCRLWAKAGYYQAGGANGFRDQLQDAMALAWARPDMLRAQILLAASRQFEAGDVQHWWHSPGGAGVRTHFSDDLLWLPFAIHHHQRTTGDASLLDEAVPFLQGAPVPEGAEDSYTTPVVGDTPASVYEHAARALDHSLGTGAHGLPLMGTGDWNDGMNRVGHGGRGESVWLAWFLCAITPDWVTRARNRGDTIRAERWALALTGWRDALNGSEPQTLEDEAGDGAWDGAWYKRAYFDDGTPLGSHTQPEGRIDLLAQAWAVLSDAAPPQRQLTAMASADALLVNPTFGLVQLLTPPLVTARPDAGYIQAYPPGVRENGGQYTHAAVWALMASAQLAREQGADAERPYRYFTYLSPAHRAAHPVWGAAYGLEPYVAAGDVYSQPPYVGRGGWSWYTGAAGWMHRAGVESILGLHWQADRLRLEPCLPGHWPRAQLTLVRGSRRLVFTLLRGSPAEVHQALAAEQAQLLWPGQPLVWGPLTGEHRFVVPLTPSDR
jgi:cyclic beta-1,2-glucan synthetase